MHDHRTEILYGVGLGVASFLWICLEFAAGLHTSRIALHPVVTNFFAVIPIAILWRVLKLRRDREGQLSWGSAIGCGMLVSAVAALLNTPTQWVFHTWVNPSYFRTMIDFAVRQGQSTRAEAEQYFNFKHYLLEGTVGPLVAGLITTAILTAFMRRRPAQRPPIAA